MIWTIEAASDDNFDILLIFSAKNKKIEMPGKLKKISNSFFLNYQITIYSASETLFISKIGEDEIQVSFGFGKENKTISFKKEE